MATKVWKGHLRFGMLTIPVYLNVGARDKRIELNTFHTQCHGQIKMPKWCAVCDRMVAPEEIYKGYNTGNGIVQLTQKELDDITPETQHVMEVENCVRLADVDPLYLAESFYVLPDEAGKKAYSLLVKALTDTGRCALAQVSKSGREHMVVLRPKGNGLILNYLWYETEIAKVPEFDNIQMEHLSSNEIKLAGQLVESMSGEFDPSEFADGYFQRLNVLIQSKLDSTVAAPTPVKGSAPAPTQDLMAALSASLANPKPKRSIKLEDTEVKVPAAKAKGGKKIKAA